MFRHSWCRPATSELSVIMFGRRESCLRRCATVEWAKYTRKVTTSLHLTGLVDRQQHGRHGLGCSVWRTESSKSRWIPDIVRICERLVASDSNLDPVPKAVSIRTAASSIQVYFAPICNVDHRRSKSASGTRYLTNFGPNLSL